MATAKLVYYQDDSGQWRWQVRSANGRVIDASSEGFASKRNAEQNYSLNHSNVAGAVHSE